MHTTNTPVFLAVCLTLADYERGEGKCDCSLVALHAYMQLDAMQQKGTHCMPQDLT